MFFTKIESILADAKPCQDVLPDDSGLLPRNVSTHLLPPFRIHALCLACRMAKILAINAPSSFTFIWSIIKPWLSKETSDKVDIRGSNYQAVLLDLIDAESLPAIFGGKCTCGGEEDGTQCLYSSAGPWIEGRIGWGPHAAEKTEKEHDANDAVVSDPPVAIEVCA